MSAYGSRAWQRSFIIALLLIALTLFLFSGLGENGRSRAAAYAEWASKNFGRITPSNSGEQSHLEQLHAPSSTSHSNATDPCLSTPFPSGEHSPQSAKNTLVLITGGAGFIGSNLADRLVGLGYRVRILDNLYTGFIRNVPLHRKEVEFIHGDILDPEVLKRAVKDVEYVYHLAAMSKVLPSVRDPEMARFCTENNALGTWNVLNATREQAVVKKVVYAGSSTYYGNRPIPHNEDNAPDFLTPYAASKYEGEMQMQMFDNLFHVPTITNRFFMVYGPRQPTTGAYAIVTGVFARQASQGKPLTIEGDGTHFRDFIHVSDIVTGLVLSQQLKDVKGGIPINLGSGEYFSVKDVADMISDNQVHVAERKNDLVGTLADTCRMKKLLGYRTKADFKKEMSFMAQETMKGNVFAQEWLTPLLALSAPHVVPVGSPILPWAEYQNDLDALLEKIELVKQSIVEPQESQQNRLISVIPFGDSDDELDAQVLLLLNTVYSLVRFGNVRRYIVAALSAKHLAICQDYNMPCFESSSQELPGLVRLLNNGQSQPYDVHMAPIGTVIVDSLLNSKINGAGITHLKPNGGFVLSSRSEQSTSNVKPDFLTSRAGSDVEEDTLVSSVMKALSKGKSVTVKVGEVDHLCSTGKDSSSHKTCPKTAMQTLACNVKPGSGYPGGMAGKILSLRNAGLWQLSDCTNGKYCEKQQNVPLRWIQNPPDLSTSGRLCTK